MRILSHEIGLKDVGNLRKREKERSGAKKRLGIKKSQLFFGLVALAFLAVLACPAPKSRQYGGIELIGEDPEVEVYGPQLPETIVGGYTKPSIESVVLPEETDTPVNDTIVYATEDQKNYHLSTCKFAYASAKRLTVYEAYYLGYTPGKCCGAPSYTPK